jgi:hypothetical protein
VACLWRRYDWLMSLITTYYRVPEAGHSTASQWTMVRASVGAPGRQFFAVSMCWYLSHWWFVQFISATRGFIIIHNAVFALAYECIEAYWFRSIVLMSIVWLSDDSLILKTRHFPDPPGAQEPSFYASLVVWRVLIDPRSKPWGVPDSWTLWSRCCG